ncbi:MAG: hypothetical protein U5L01_03735 [Rheinheimera sp.]|nr:hypothetical protein [Rheinheimera sp.]
MFAVAIWGLIPVLVRYRLLAADNSVSLLNYLPALLIGTGATLVLSYIYFSREQAFSLQQALDRAEINRINKEKKCWKLGLGCCNPKSSRIFYSIPSPTFKRLSPLNPNRPTRCWRR